MEMIQTYTKNVLNVQTYKRTIFRFVVVDKEISSISMVESYWLIGLQIVEHEQHGEARADYGKKLLKELAARLTIDFGKGFDERELRKMRQFYMEFKKRDTLRPELTWSQRITGTGF